MKQYEVSTEKEMHKHYIMAESAEDAKAKYIADCNASCKRQLSMADVNHCVLSDKVRLEKVVDPYTSSPHTGVHVSIDSLRSHLANIEQYGDLVLQPDFQRAHVWTEDQQIKFVEHLLRGGQTGLNIYFNRAPGWDDEKNESYPTVLVDGLQRLTAVLRFLNGDMVVFGKYTVNSFQYFNNINLIVYTNNLKTRKEVLRWYIEMNSGGTAHTKEEIEKVVKLLEKE